MGVSLSQKQIDVLMKLCTNGSLFYGSGGLNERTVMALVRCRLVVMDVNVKVASVTPFGREIYMELKKRGQTI